MQPGTQRAAASRGGCPSTAADEEKGLPAPLHFHFIPNRGACGKPRVVPHNCRPKPEATEWEESGYDRACGGDRRRRSDRADVGGRVGVGGGRRRPCRGG